MEEITLYHHGLPVTRHPLYGARFAIGADPEADLRLAGAACEPGLTLLRAGQGRWQARVGGDEARPVELAPGERLTLGAYAVEYRTATEPEATDERAAASTLGLVGVSLRIGVLRASLLRLAPLGAPVLVRGETGTGKELVAKALHRLSPRARGPFVALNCAALTPGLLEDRLFGHERGSYTGAGASHRGVFEQASGGTLFLDEIGELPLDQQAVLLRVLEEGQVRRIGAEAVAQVDTRIVTATNRDLAAQIATGRFRADLYHRLSTLELVTAPLRERPEDLAPLATHFLRGMEPEIGRHRLSRSAVELLARHDWPGNARELRNVLYRAAAFCPRERIEVSDLDLRPSGTKEHRGTRLAQISDAEVHTVLACHQGNVTSAARALSIPRSTLRDRLRSRRRPGEEC